LSLIALLRSPAFFVALFDFDADLAKSTAKQDCPHCRAPLHRADYARKPRGMPDSLPAKHSLRFSFCCSREDCRKRTTPPSVRFLGRRVFTTTVILLVCAMRHGLTPARVRELLQSIPVSARTLERWRTFWLEHFPTTVPFVQWRARIVPPPDLSVLPRSILDAFAHLPLSERVQQILFGLIPLSTRSPIAFSCFSMVF
jgi:hypothetical protein